MNDLKKDLKKIESYFKRFATLEGLNAAEELLYMYIGIINSESGGFIAALVERTGLDEDTLSLILDEYTLEVGSVMAALMQEVAEAIGSNDMKIVGEKIGKLAQEIIDFMGEESNEVLQKLIHHYQEEYKTFKSINSFKSEMQEMIAEADEGFVLFNLDVKRVDEISQKDRYQIVGALLQEVFMIMGMVSMTEGSEVGNMISQEEHEDADFDIKEKMAKEIAKARQNEEELYERADFAFSKSDKVVCNICHEFFAPRSLQRHVGSCAKKYVEDGGTKQSYLLKISDKYMKDYFLHVLVSEDAILQELDTFLRDIWLECCGHMSAFRQGYDELDMDESVVCLKDAKKTEYTYDFGSSTNLIIEFKKEFVGSQEHLIKLVARNSVIKAECHHCEKKDAKYICTECMYGGDEVIFCENCVTKHTKKYHDGEDYMISHFLNSPRTGVCGYGAMEEEL